MFNATPDRPVSSLDRFVEHPGKNSIEEPPTYEKAAEIWQHVQQCGSQLQVTEHLTCGARVVMPIFCGSRWCPRCGKRWRLQTTGAVADAIRKMRFPAHLVLTIRNSNKGELARMWRDIETAFEKLRHRKILKRKRGIAGRGCTWNEEKQTWHAHLHVVLDATWIPADKLREAWKKITAGAGLSPQINRVTNPYYAALEVVAGTRKDGKADLERIREHEDTTVIDEYVESLDKKKQVWAFGGLKLQRLETQKPGPCRCPRCKAAYDWREWIRYEVDKQELEILEFGPRWKDCYSGFLREHSPNDP